MTSPESTSDYNRSNVTVFARLASEVKLGDVIEAILVTEWSKDGYATYLEDFHSLIPHASDVAVLPSMTT